MGVVGIVVLFNPGDEVISIYESYKYQFEKIIFIDNSEKKNTDVINFLESDKKNIYYSKNGNIGLAKALAYGCELALKLGFKYACLLDQDTFVENNCISELTKYILDDRVGLVAPNIKFMIRDANNKLVINKVLDSVNRNKYVNFAITSGSLIDLTIYKRIGGIDKELFIGQIDQDYCTNLNKNGYYLYRVGSAFIQQEAGKGKICKFLNKKIVDPQYPANRYYYIFRNEIYLRRKWGCQYNINKVNLLKYLIIIVFCAKNKVSSLYGCVCGFIDGVKYEKNKLL